MKFVVTQDVFNVTEVKLHWESKDKIKKFLYWTSCVVVTAGTIVWILEDKKKENEEV